MRYVVDQDALARLLRGEVVSFGHDLLQIEPSIGWLRMIELCVAAARAPVPPRKPSVQLRPSPRDPPQAHEFLPNEYTRERRDD